MRLSRPHGMQVLTSESWELPSGPARWRGQVWGESHGKVERQPWLFPRHPQC